MRRVVPNILWGGLLRGCLLITAVVGCVRQPPGRISCVARTVLSDGREAQVLARYSGFPDGYDVSFFYRHSDGEWYGYYLEHEADSWRDAKLDVRGERIVIKQKERDVAAFNLESYIFEDLEQGLRYSLEDGKEGDPLSSWGIGDTSVVVRPRRQKSANVEDLK